MTKDLSNVRIYGDEDGAVWVAPKGATGPVDLSAPGVGFDEIGWISEDGVSLDGDSDAFTGRAWQGAKIVRRKVTRNDRTFKFQALETNLVTHGMRFRGQTPTVAGGVAVTKVTNQTANDDRAWVFDFVDGDITDRYVIPAGSYMRSGSVVYRSSDMTVYEFEVTPLGDYDHITNDPAITGL